MWREPINLASIPNRLRPAVYDLPARQEYKRRHNELNNPYKQEGGVSHLCTKCTKPHTYVIHFTRRYVQSSTHPRALFSYFYVTSSLTFDSQLRRMFPDFSRSDLLCVPSAQQMVGYGSE